jgi:CTP-dependent riboflavin kinase
LSKEQILDVTITYGELKAEFRGDPQQVLVSVNEFLAKNIANLDLASKVTINYSLNDLIKMFGDYVKITPEGPRVWVGEQKLSDKGILGLQLVAAKINHESGKVALPSLTLTEMRTATGLNPKSISSRMSEMLKWGYVDKETSEEGVRYKITTQGINWLNQMLAKKVGKS